MFYDTTNSALMFIRALDTVGDLWPSTPVTLDNRGRVGSYCRSYVFNGKLYVWLARGMTPPHALCPAQPGSRVSLQGVNVWA